MVGEFIGITRINHNVIKDLNSSAANILRDKLFTSYFEGALQRVIDMKKYDVRMIETSGRFWGEIDFLEDYQRVKAEISDELLRF